MDIKREDDGSLILSFFTEWDPPVKQISIIFPKKTTKDELLVALQDSGMILTKDIRYYTKKMLIEIYGYRSKSLLQQIYLKSL